MWTPGAEFARRRLPRADQPVERTNVRIREVADVNVVAETGSVRRRIAVAAHLQAGAARRRPDSAGADAAARPPPGSAGEEVDFRRVVFADLAVGIRAGCIEVAQRHRTQPVGPL